LASLHDLLVRQDWAGAKINDLIEAQLSPFVTSPERLDAGGPTLLLTPAAAQAISLALHELATNASKYGAWSTAVGKVLVHWEIVTADGQRRFILTWQEVGGPAVTPPERQGFGSLVLNRMTAHTFTGSTTSYDFEPQGVRWRIDADAEVIRAG
jgi:two-component sensor histidine kinase